MPSFGRIKIKMPIDRVTADNVVDVINRALPLHNVNKADCERLYDIFTGNQPILKRIKQFRPEITNKVIINHANEIVSFKTSYLLFEPIVYVARNGAEKSDPGVTDKVARLNSMMSLCNKAAHDMELGTFIHACGHGIRMPLPRPDYNEDDGLPPFEIFTLDPRSNFIVYNSGLGEKELCLVSYVDRQFAKGNAGEYHMLTVYSVYTDSEYFEVCNGEVIAHMSHNLREVPGIEYIGNIARLGSFEIVESILEAINTLASNRIDATEQTVQSIMCFINCDIDKDKFKQLQEMCGITLKSVDGMQSDIKMLSADLKQADQQVLMDSLYTQLLHITGMPSQSGGDSSDSSNNGATIVRNGWYNAEARAKETDTLWSASENKLRRIVLHICREAGVMDLKPANVEDKFTRRNYEDILARSQTLTTLLSSKVAPHRAYVASGMFMDPEEAYREWEEWEKTHPAEEKPNKENTNTDTKETGE